MKTTNSIRILFLVILLTMVAAAASYARNPLPTPAEKLQTMLKESIAYPEQAVKNCCTGFVDLVFSVDEDGKIIIDKTKSDNANLEKMVKEQLSTVCCKGVKVPTYEHYKIRITFKLIG